MATNENPTSHNQNHNMVDIPLYTESKITRKQAIREIADVILHSNMKPRMVKYSLQLLQKLLPVDNTLPTTIDELFGAMMSSENDWRLAQYLIKYKQSPSFLPSSSLSLPFNSNESSSSSDDENELSPYDRLQQCLRPITDISNDFHLNYATSLYNNSNNSLSLNQTSSSVNPSTFLGSISETSSTASTYERDLLCERIYKAFEDDTDDETSDENKKLCCFEINGYNLLNGNKRRRYY